MTMQQPSLFAIICSMPPREKFIVYGGTGHHKLDDEILKLVNATTGLGIRFGHLWYHVWPDGEPGFRPENPERIKDRHVIIFSSPVTVKLESELMDLVTGAKKQYGARSVMVVLPFLRYRRQDRSENGHEITRLRWFISNLKHWGATKLIVCEPHSVVRTEEYCKEFGLELYISDPTKLFVEKLRGVVETLGGADEVRIYSPDFGSVGRAIALAKELGIAVVATPKKRINGRITPMESKDFLDAIRKRYGADAPVTCDMNDLRGMNVIMREDEVDTGGTAVMTAYKLREIGAKSVRLAATHPVCSPGWKMKLFPHNEPQPFDAIWLGNTRPRGFNETEYEGSTGGRVEEVNVAPAIAETLVRILEGIEPAPSASGR